MQFGFCISTFISPTDSKNLATVRNILKESTPIKILCRQCKMAIILVMCLETEQLKVERTERKIVDEEAIIFLLNLNRRCCQMSCQLPSINTYLV